MIKTQKEFIKKLHTIKKSTFDVNVNIEPKDVLFIIDMQNDFIDRPYKENVGTFSRPGKKNTQTIHHQKGKLPTHNSKNIIKGIETITKKFKKNQGIIIATRDYHPIDPEHCSFSIFGEHCVWNTIGSDIVKEIEKQLVTKNKLNKNCHIVFKAFNHKIDSFGAFPYSKKGGIGRICGCKKSYCPTGWTGSFMINGKYTRYPNLPKIMGSKLKNKTTPIKKILKKNKVSKTKNSIFVCGVLGDFCVLDTAKNARLAGYKNVYIVIDLIRSLRLIKNKKIVYPTTPQMFIKEATKNKFKFVLSRNLSF